MYMLELYFVEWQRLCCYDDGKLEEAKAACRRFCYSEKTDARVRRHEDILFVEMYNRANDPDAYNDVFQSEEEDFGLSWQECGF